MNDTARKNLGLVVGIIGSLVIILSVMIGWISIDATLTDSSSASVTISGWRVLTESGASEVIEGTFIPAIVICLGVATMVLCVATRYSSKVPRPHTLTIILGLGTLLCDSAFKGMNGAIVDTGGSSYIPGTIDTTPWLDSLFPEAIDTAFINADWGCFVGVVGHVIALLGVYMMYWTDHEADYVIEIGKKKEQ